MSQQGGMMFKFLKCWFGRHDWQVAEANFQYGRAITSEASRGLTVPTVYDWKSTDHDACPFTVINTHYTVGSNVVTLYCRKCKKCGVVWSCDAFAVERHKKDNDILAFEGL